MKYFSTPENFVVKLFFKFHSIYKFSNFLFQKKRKHDSPIDFSKVLSCELKFYTGVGRVNIYYA